MLQVYSPLRRYIDRPGMRVGVVGVGGLGHLAVQFAAKMGALVSVGLLHRLGWAYRIGYDTLIRTGIHALLPICLGRGVQVPPSMAQAPVRTPRAPHSELLRCAWQVTAIDVFADKRDEALRLGASAFQTFDDAMEASGKVRGIRGGAWGGLGVGPERGA